MITRDESSRLFGPILLEAIIIETVKQINIVREKVGLPKITKQQVLNDLFNQATHLPLYDWMEQQGP